MSLFVVVVVVAVAATAIGVEVAGLLRIGVGPDRWLRSGECV